MTGSGFTAQSTAAEVAGGIDLTGRRAVVTGAASGIGLETARALAGAGAEVTLAVRDTAAGERAAADVAAGGGRVLVAPSTSRTSARWRPSPPPGTAPWTSSSTTPG